MKVALLASGRGSNVRAILDRVDAGRCHIEPVGLLSDRKDAGALDLARERGLPAIVVSPKDYSSRGEWDEALAAKIAELEPSLVVLAGFMRIVGAPMLDRFGGHIINVHPSLLPAFPGKDGPAQALAAGVRISGCTVHVVDAGVDRGPILAQGAVPVLLEDDAQSLHARIQTVEHRLLPQVIDWVATGKIRLGDELVLRAAAPDHISALVYPPLAGE